MPSPFGAWSTVSSIHFEWFFLWPQVISSHTCGEKYLAKYLRPNLCRSPEFSVCVVLFLHYSVLRILMTLTSLGSQLCLLSVGSLTISAWVPPPCTTAWKTLKPGNEGSCRAGLIHFPCLRDHYHSLFHILCPFGLPQAEGWMQPSLLLCRHRVRIAGSQSNACLALIDITQSLPK